MNKEIIVTDDGSPTIYLPEMNEHYHSVHGAVQESRHIYIEQGLLRLTQNNATVLEIGFGTGLNAFLTYVFALNNNLTIRYISIEKYPLSQSEHQQLAYHEHIFAEHGEAFKKIYKADWGTMQTIAPWFSILKIHADLLDFVFEPDHQADLLYYDAFAPSKQPEMWTNETINKVAAHIKNGGLMTTYCAKGSVRRAFASAGFAMERVAGPPGKKEILRGKKISTNEN